VNVRGVCYFLQESIDRQDEVFGGTIGFSSPSGLNVKTEWAGYVKELEGPFRLTPSELDLSEDIEFYKEEACFESSNHDFDMCSRNYRGYLFSSIALVDCYINRHIVLSKFNGKRTNNFERLQKSTNTEERIDLFVTEFCDFSFSDLKQTKIWSDFAKLRGLRNEVVHSVSPFIGISLKEICSNLNLSIRGVGAFLKKMQVGQGRCSLGFIEKVRTSPIIEYNQVFAQGDGTYKQKRHFSKQFSRH